MVISVNSGPGTSRGRGRWRAPIRFVWWTHTTPGIAALPMIDFNLTEYVYWDDGPWRPGGEIR